MRILTYKRTHIGDPNPDGLFGIKKCMGRVRNYDYDAVIGIGGNGYNAIKVGIARKINWVGIGPTLYEASNKRACDVTFEYFLYLEEEGPLLATMAPNLAKRMNMKGARFLLNGYTEKEYKEAITIIKWSRTQESSKTAGLYRQPERNCCSSACSLSSCKKTR